MSLWLSLPIAISPSLMFLAVLRWWDRREPEPRRLIVRLFTAGVIAAALILLLRLLTAVALVSAGILPPTDLSLADGLLPTALAVLVTAAIQQSAILGTTIALTYRVRFFTQIVDGIVYAGTVAAGVALLDGMVRLLGIETSASLPRSVSPPFEMFFPVVAAFVAAGFSGLGLGEAVALRHHHAGAAAAPLGRGLVEAITFNALFLFLMASHLARLSGALVILGAVYLLTRFTIARYTQLFSPSQNVP